MQPRNNMRRFLDFVWDWELFWEYLRFGFAAMLVAAIVLTMKRFEIDEGWRFAVTFTGGMVAHQWIAWCRA